MHPGLLVLGAAHTVGGGHHRLYLPPEGVAGGVRGAVYQRVLNMQLQLSTTNGCSEVTLLPRLADTFIMLSSGVMPTPAPRNTAGPGPGCSTKSPHGTPASADSEDILDILDIVDIV